MGDDINNYDDVFVVMIVVILVNALDARSLHSPLHLSSPSPHPFSFLLYTLHQLPFPLKQLLIHSLVYNNHNNHINPPPSPSPIPHSPFTHLEAHPVAWRVLDMGLPHPRLHSLRSTGWLFLGMPRRTVPLGAGNWIKSKRIESMQIESNKIECETKHTSEYDWPNTIEHNWRLLNTIGDHPSNRTQINTNCAVNVQPDRMIFISIAHLTNEKFNA